MLTYQRSSAFYSLIVFLGILMLGSAVGMAQTVIYEADFWAGSDQDWVPKSFWHANSPGPYFDLQTYQDRGVLWCGREDPDYRGGSGYGDGWGMYIEKEFWRDEYTGAWQLAFDIQYDVEEGFDRIYVIVGTDPYAKLTNWQTLDEFTGPSAGFEHHVYDLPSLSSFARVRFMFESDSDISDESPGQWPFFNSDGAFRLDYVSVTDSSPSQLFWEDTFDSDMGGWEEGKQTGASLYHLISSELTEEPPLGEPVIPPPPGGDPIAPFWSAIAWDFSPYRFPPQRPDYPDWFMGIESPVIDIPADTEITLQFEVFTELPLYEELFYVYQIAAPPPDQEDGGAWRNYNVIYYGSGGWHTVRENITSLIAPGATQLRVHLGARYYSPYPFPSTGVFSGPGPAFGNVLVEAMVENPVGALAGRISGEDGSGKHGVLLNLFDDVGANVENYVTDEDGYYGSEELPVGSYQLSLVEPLGYAAAADEVDVSIVPGETTQADFVLSEAPSQGEIRGVGYWKHQVNEAAGGGGLGHGRRLNIDEPVPPDIESPICDLLDLVTQHFNDNAINQVEVYAVPVDALCVDKLDTALGLLNLQGNQEMVAHARKHLMALLLNAAAGYIHLATVISEDGATVSQAITYCDNLIDDPAGDHELAKDIAERICDGSMVPAETIPLDTDDILYYQGIQGESARLGNRPNPFNPATTIHFVLPSARGYRLSIFNPAGQLVRSFSAVGQKGLNEVLWNGRTDDGRKVGSGVYLSVLAAGNLRDTAKLMLLK